MTYTMRHASMRVTALTPGQHERTCGYWYTVTCGSAAHAAFTTKRGLLRWLAQRGLSLDGELPEATGEFATMPVIGEYYSSSHGEFSPTDDRPYRMIEDVAWLTIRPVIVTTELSNGEYTLALITEKDGIRTVHTLNCNVKTRLVAANHAQVSAAMR